MATQCPFDFGGYQIVLGPCLVRRADCLNPQQVDLCGPLRVGTIRAPETTPGKIKLRHHSANSRLEFSRVAFTLSTKQTRKASRTPGASLPNDKR